MTSSASMPIVIRHGFHGIVTTTFRGMAAKTAKLTDSSGNIISFHLNCAGETSPSSVLLGDPDNDQTFQLELNGYSFECGQAGTEVNNLAQVIGPIGGSENGVSVNTYLFARDGHPHAFDTICITIIVQMGIDPTVGE